MNKQLERRAARMREKYRREPVSNVADIRAAFESWRRNKRRRPGDHGVWTTKQTARLIGAEPATLQSWDEQGLLSPAARGARHNGRGNRLYSNAQLEILLNAQKLRRAGLRPRAAILIAKARADVASVVDSLTLLKLSGVQLVTVRPAGRVKKAQPCRSA
jgi:hypothetical protein